MKKNVVVFLLLFFLSLTAGCSVWSEAVDHSADVISTGETAVEIGTVTTAFNPAIGVLVLTAGGLVIAVGKMLAVFGKKESN